MNKARILTWEIGGVCFISLSGSLLHFAYGLLGERPLVALIAAVNESVWEHLKLAFWPALLYAFIEWPFLRGQAKSFWTAKAIGIFIMPLIIVSSFYGYTALAGHNILWVDISLFILAVLTGQTVSGWLLFRRSFPSGIKVLAIILLVLMVAAFSLLTFFPPSIPLFYDPRNGLSGISK